MGRGASVEYGYSFDDEAPRFALNTLWFPLGVIVFAFTVLIMAAIVTGGPDRDYYLNVQQAPANHTKPAVTLTRPVLRSVAICTARMTVPHRCSPSRALFACSACHSAFRWASSWR